MKTFRLSVLFALPLICVLVATGCASSRPVVNTWRNPAFSPTPTNTIALTLHEGAKPEDAETGQLLQAELQREGFVLVPEERADYLLTYVVSENQEEHDWVDNQSLAGMPPSQAPGQVAVGPSTSYASVGVEHSYVVQNRDIRLLLYTNPKTNPAGLQMVWQGTITVEKGHSSGDEQVQLRTLLHYFGGDENGTVNLAP